ncbi:MAG: protein kinase [Deltaproteobacteria bacterium]
MAAGTSRSRIGTTVAGKYRLESLLGEGGMGAVYEAEHVVTHRRVAVKLLHASLGWSETFVERFLLEAQVATKIGHPNIIEVLDAGVDEDGACYAVLTLLKGESVARMLERLGKLQLADALTITLEVLDALAAAHAMGVVHRDIKPDNVFIANGPRGERQIKLLDFGISKVIADNSADAAQGRRGLTATGAIMGTAEYMSPEQVNGERAIDGRADLWSLGVMLFEMIAGQVPFTGKTLHMVLAAVLDEPLPSLVALRPDVPSGVVRVVERVLRKDAAERYATADVMIAELRVELERVPGTAVAPVKRLSLTDGSAPPTGQHHSPIAMATAPTIASLETGPQRAVVAAPGTLTGLERSTDLGLLRPTAPAPRRPTALWAGVAAIAVAVLVGGGLALSKVRLGASTQGAPHPATSTASPVVPVTPVVPAVPVAPTTRPGVEVPTALPVPTPALANTAPDLAHVPSPTIATHVTQGAPATATVRLHGRGSHAAPTNAAAGTTGSATAPAPNPPTTHVTPPTRHGVPMMRGIDD